MAAHRPPYAASASVGYIDDLRKKVLRAQSCGGPSYIHVHVPCPPGWGYDPEKTVSIARLAVQTLIWPLYEILDGIAYRLTYSVAKPKKVEEYLRTQRRFKALPDSACEEIQQEVDTEYRQLQAQCQRQ